jgi:hypothetical protein
MPSPIRLRPRAKRLLDYTDTDIVDRYLEFLLASKDRHLWVGKVLIDVDQVIRRRFACTTHLCLWSKRDGHAPHPVRSRHSCCVDLDVQLLPTEVEAIERHLPKVLAGHADVAGHVAEHGFWRYDEEWWKILQKKGDGSCAFLTYSPEMGQHVCGLHATALRERISLAQIKPLICRMFPIFLLETGDQHILTCYGPETHRLLFDEEYTRMNCLHDNPHATDHVYRALRGALEALIGPEGYRQLAEAAEEILARDTGNGSSNGGNGR